MGSLNKGERSFLEGKFGGRVTFDRIERKLYGHDIAAMPMIMKPIIGSTIPEAVVQPETEEELITLVKWANKNRIPLTPRGKASSGYGGVLPVKGGVVVDFFRMNKVISIDKTKQTVTAQAGIVWEKIDRALKKEGLTVNLYPSSYPGSTVGGWLAQGGTGIGSFESGWFVDNVLGARVVLPDGTVKEFFGKDIELISEAEGITGLISTITIKAMKDEKLSVVAIGCPDALNTQKLIESMISEKLPIWSLMFINPRMAELKNRSPLIEQHGHPAEERVLLPASYIITIAYRERNAGIVNGKIVEMIKPCEAEILSEKVARHEWKNRFKLMVVKRLGPSLIPTEIVIPLAELGAFMEEIEHKINQPIVKEGVVVQQGKSGQPEVVILGFIPADQRKFSYNLVFTLAMTVINIAERHGGRAYATGLYFAKKAKQVLGGQRVRRIKEFKKSNDPRGILNPHKVLDNGFLGSVMGVAKFLEPFGRPFGNYVITKIGERPTKPVRDIPADVAWYAYGCSQCGYCVEECDQFYGRGWESQSPRGKWYWLREYMEGREEWNQFMVDTMLVCTTCEICNLRCSAALPIEPSWMKLRGKLIHEEKKMTFPPFEIMGAALTKEGDIWAGYRKNRWDWFPKDLLDKHGPGKKAKTVYFAGCTASYVEHDIGMASVRLLDKAGVDFVTIGNKENCCGTPMLVAGKWDIFAETMKKNIAAVKAAGADSVVTSCPACDMMWRHTYPEWAKKLGVEFGITTRHYSEVVAEQIRKGKFSFPKSGKKKEKVTWHDSCHIGRVSGVYDEPRDLIKANPNADFVEMPFNRTEAHCCGSVLTLIKEPPVAAEVGKVRIDEAVEVGAQKILALCPCCEFQLRVSADKKKIPIEVVDLARYSSEALGFTFPDPNPEVKRQWAVFEAMIALMTPEGFAELMGTMWKELIDAMPLRHGADDAGDGKDPRRTAAHEADVPDPLPAAAADDDAQGHADDAVARGGQDPDARLYA